MATQQGEPPGAGDSPRRKYALVAAILVIAVTVGFVTWTLVPHIEVRDVEFSLSPCSPTADVMLGLVDFTLHNSGYLGGHVTWQVFIESPASVGELRGHRETTFVAGQAEERVQARAVDSCQIMAEATLTVRVVRVEAALATPSDGTSGVGDSAMSVRLSLASTPNGVFGTST